MVPAHSHERRRIVSGRRFGSVRRVVKRQRSAGNHAAADGERDSIEEVAARDRAVHSEFFVAFIAVITHEGPIRDHYSPGSQARRLGPIRALSP